MHKILLIIFAAVVCITTGCTQTTVTQEDVDVEVTDEYSDEEVVVESDDGYDAEAERLLQGNGYFMNVVEGYTIPATEADVEATSSTILNEANGEPYKVVKHIGLDD